MPDQVSDFKLLLNTWFNAPDYREERRFLESHLELLVPECEHLLRDLVARHTERTELAQELRDHVDVLHDARMRGRTVEAVREAYVDRYGGLVLDLPAWLEEAVQVLDEFEGIEDSEQAAQAFIALLRKTIARARR